jgi:YD repeat-containing protein
MPDRRTTVRRRLNRFVALSLGAALVVVGLPLAPRGLLSVLPVPDTYGEVLAQSGSLIAHWDFDEDYVDPDANDDDTPDERTLAATAGGIDAKAYRSTILGQPGVSGNAISNTDSGRWGFGYVRVAELISGTYYPYDELQPDEFTAEIWIRTVEDHATYPECFFLHQNSGFQLCHNNGELFAYVHTTGTDVASTGNVDIATGDIDVNDGEWHHVALTFEKGDGGSEPSEGILYVDGTTQEGWDDEGRNGIVSWSTSGEGIMIGAVRSSTWLYPAYPWNGDLDEPALFDGPLDASLVSTHWENGPENPPAQPPEEWTTGDYSEVVAEHGPVSQWRMDENEGAPPGTATMADSAGDNDATINNPSRATFEKDPPHLLGEQETGGSAVEFNPSTYGDAGNDPTLNPPNETSIEAWVKVGAGQGGKIAGWDAEVALGVSGGVPYMNAWGLSWAQLYQATNVDVNIADSQWHHLVGVVDGRQLVLWVDGAPVSTVTMKEWMNYGGGPPPFTIGGFTGQLDEVALYDTALTPVQVWSHVQASGSDNCGGWSCIALAEANEGGQVPALETGDGPDGAQPGDPVTSSNGNLTHRIADLPPTDGLRGTAIERTYNSLDLQSGLFGQGWTSTADISLTPDLFEPESRRVLRMPSGSRRTFSWTDPNVEVDDDEYWAADPGVQAALEETAQGWRVTFLGGGAWEFNRDGRLTAMDQSNGSRVTVTWAPESGVLVKFENTETGWWAKLWDQSAPAGRVEKVTDSGGREVLHTYTSGRVTTVSQPAEISSTPLAAESYAYDSAGRMTRITDAAGRLIVANTYVAGGMRIVDNQTNSNGQVTDLAVEYEAGVDGERETTVTFNDGTAAEESFTYVHNVAGSVVRIEDSAGGAVNKTYAGDRQLGSFENRLEDTWVRAYDGEGRLEQSDSPNPAGGALSAYTAYIGPGDPRPWIVIDEADTTTTYDYATSDPTDVIPAEVWTCGPQDTDGGPGDGVDAADACDDELPSTVIESSDGRIDQVTDPDGVATTYTYDDTGCVADQLCSVTTGGIETSFTYHDATGKVETTTTPDGTTTNVYDVYGRLAHVRDPMWTSGGIHATSYGYNNDGSVAWTSDPANPDTDGPSGDDKPNVAYTYWGGSFSGPTWVPETDPATSVAQPAGKFQAEVTLIDQGTDATTTTHTRYSLAGWVDSVTVASDGDAEIGGAEDDAADEATTFNVYSQLGRLIKTIDPTGVQTHFCYDADGRQTRTAVGDLSAGTINCATPQGGPSVSSTAYDSLGRVTLESDPDGRQVAYTYDAAGRVLTETHAPGQDEESVLEYHYDDLGRLWKVLADRGVDGDADRPFSHEVVEERRYTPAGRLQWTMRPPRDVLELAWAWPDDPFHEDYEDPDDEPNFILKTHYSYDSAGREIARTDPAGGVWRTDYDAAGRVECVTEPTDVIDWVSEDVDIDCASADTLGETRYQYDAAGQVTRTYQPSPTAISDETIEVSQIRTYTPTGAVASETDFAVDPTAGGTPTREFSYNAAGWLIMAEDALDTEVHYLYDLRGNRTVRQSTPAAGSAPTSCGATSSASCVLQQWMYDRSDRIDLTTDGLGRDTDSSYDDHGRLETTADESGRTQTRTYFPSGLLDTVNHDDGTTDFDVEYTYDAQGRRLTMVDPTGTTTNTYDSAGKLIGQTLPTSDELGWVWDLNGQTRSRITTNGGELRYTHDANQNLLISELEYYIYYLPLATYTYDAAGRETHEALYNGGARDWNRDNPAGVVETFDSIVGTADFTTVLTWKADGRLQKEVTADKNNCTQYAYDAAGQLDTVQTAATNCTTSLTTSHDYAYDGQGRRTSVNAIDYVYDLGSQLLGTGDGCELSSGVPDGDCKTTFDYDDAGRRTAADYDPTSGAEFHATYAWDQAGRLAQLDQDDDTSNTVIDYGSAAGSVDTGFE